MIGELIDQIFQLEPDTFLSSQFTTVGAELKVERHQVLVAQVDHQRKRCTALIDSNGSKIELHLDLSSHLIDFIAVKISPRRLKTSVWLTKDDNQLAG